MVSHCCDGRGCSYCLSKTRLRAGLDTASSAQELSGTVSEESDHPSKVFGKRWCHVKLQFPTAKKSTSARPTTCLAMPAKKTIKR